jgi:hypothetical protein
MQVRTRLAAGGSRIRTLGPASHGEDKRREVRSSGREGPPKINQAEKGSRSVREARAGPAISEASSSATQHSLLGAPHADR